MRNLGAIDRGARFLGGFVLIALSFLPPSAPVLTDFGVWRWVATAAGIVMVATAMMRFCPAYALLGINTCERK
jgi:predicted membrane-bound dolichyl-phosphate-mannose-protein mannosyltransferase